MNEWFDSLLGLELGFKSGYSSGALLLFLCIRMAFYSMPLSSPFLSETKTLSLDLEPIWLIRMIDLCAGRWWEYMPSGK